MYNIFIYMATLIIAFSPDLSYAEEEKGLLSILDFTKEKTSPEENKKEEQTSSEDAHQKMIQDADNGDVSAQLNLGYLFLYGNKDIPADASKAFHYYSLAAAQNDNIAINNLGSLYYSGIGTTADVAKAMELFEKAHELGKVEAAVNLAFLYMTENPRSIDSSKAMDLFMSAAKGNNPTAQFMVGYAYRHGFIFPKDYGKAFEYLQKSALAQFDEAQYQTALLYMEGLGVPQNYGKAVTYLNAAVGQGHLKAMVTLAQILSEGRKYPRNIYKAHILYNLAAVLGAPNASINRDNLGYNMKIEDILRAQAEADAFRAAPSELTGYITQTFGKNITAYVDRYIVPEEPKQEPKAPPENANKKGLL